MRFGWLKQAARHDPSDVRYEYIEPAELWPLLTKVALWIAVGVVVAQATLLQVIREPFEAAPGSVAPPRATGAAESLLLSMLMMLPAVLILVRRIVDKTYVLRTGWTHWLLLALGTLAFASVGWASDRFIAGIGGLQLFAGTTLVWSMSQLVRSWLRLRIIAGVCAGLLIVYVAQGLLYRFVELPDTQRMFERTRDEFLQQRGWEPDSFQARQFERKLMAGEMTIFSASPNTYSAALVGLGVIGAGLALQRRRDGDDPGWWLPLILISAAAYGMIFLAQTRAAMLSPLLAGVAFWFAWRYQAALRAYSRRAFWASLALVGAVSAAIVGHGMYHGTLFHDSLTFRWDYWLGSWPAFLERPIVGWGYGNFVTAYLPHRLVRAAEEIRDPHNVVVRTFVELGAIGGAILVLAILRGAWAVTRAIVPPTVAPAGSKQPVIWAVFLLALSGVTWNTLFGIDFRQDGWFIAIELLKRGAMLGLLMIGLAVGCARSAQSESFDGRPAPLILLAMVIALGVLLLHAMIDMVVLEPGPMAIFAMILGSVLGVRAPSRVGERRWRWAPAFALAGASVAWIALAATVVTPVLDAEAKSRSADDAIRESRFTFAAELLRSATHDLPPLLRNAEYHYRAARALAMGGSPAAQVLAQASLAIDADPRHIRARLLRAAVAMTTAPPDWPMVLSDYDKAVGLNPNDLQIRRDYARVLETTGRNDQAVRELREVLAINSQLRPDEPERLDDQAVGEIERAMDRLSRRPEPG
jgi:hypothetical protein